MNMSSGQANRQNPKKTPTPLVTFIQNRYYFSNDRNSRLFKQNKHKTACQFSPKMNRNYNQN